MASSACEGVLHVEVRLRTTPFVRADDIRDDVAQWLLRNFEWLSVGDCFTALENPEHNEYIELIKVDGYSGPERKRVCFTTQEIALDVQLYRLYTNDNEDIGSASMIDEDDDVLKQLHLMPLPAVSLDGLWESLIYPEHMHSDLLRLAARMLKMTRNRKVDKNLIYWNGLFLLHGPPGSGKTTLCRGLAQKLKIRLGHVYLNGMLIEIHTEVLFSKFFGESGKLVGQIFDRIEALADLDDETLLCIMIDEVETLVAPRENSAFGGEVADAMRVTNGVLTALDRLRNRPNVIVLCTSNIIDAIDSAFMDRADVIQLVPDPGPDAVYGILRSSFNELIKQGILTSTTVYEPHESSSATNDTDTDNNHDSTLQDPALFPSLGIVELMAAEDSSATKLLNISKQCLGMSGRTLRKLPSKAVGLYTYSDQPSVEEVLDALQKTADKEKSVKTG